MGRVFLLLIALVMTKPVWGASLGVCAHPDSPASHSSVTSISRTIRSCQDRKPLPKFDTVVEVDDFKVVDLTSDVAHGKYCDPKSFQSNPYKKVKGGPPVMHNTCTSVLQNFAESSKKDPSWNFISNGSFTQYGPPAVDLVHDGNLTHFGDDPTWYRGGIARLSNGQTRMCYLNQKRKAVFSGLDANHRLFARKQDELEEINQACGGKGLKVIEFMGGGIQFIHDGNPVDDEELNRQQEDAKENFGRSFGMTFYGEKNGKLYLIQRMTDLQGGDDIDDPYKAVLNEFCDAGFESVVRFDGASGFFGVEKTPSGDLKYSADLGPSTSYLGVAVKGQVNYWANVKAP